MADTTDKATFLKRIANFDVQIDAFGVLHATYDLHSRPWDFISSWSFRFDLWAGCLCHAGRVLDPVDYVYRCKQVGRVGATEPDWSAAWPVDGMPDGTVVWERFPLSVDMRSVYYRRTGAPRGIEVAVDYTGPRWPARIERSHNPLANPNSRHPRGWQKFVWVGNGIRPQLTILPDNELRITYELAEGGTVEKVSEDGGRTWA